MAKIGVLTIGQTPRADITNDLQALLPPDIRLAEYGALDGLTLRQAQAMLGYDGSGELLVTRMGASPELLMLSGKGVMARMQTCIDRAQNDGADLLLMACTGEFPEYCHRIPLLMPGACQREAARELAGGRPIGVLIPKNEQQEQMHAWWQRSGVQAPLMAAVDPFAAGIEDLLQAALRLKAQGAAILCMDCFGYTLAHKTAAEQASGLPVVLARQVLAEQALNLLKMRCDK